MQVAKRDSELKKKLSSCVLKLLSKTSVKSNVWKTFSMLVDAASSEPHGFVQCNVCKRFLTYSGGKTGTSHLSRHWCKPAQPTTPITSFLQEKAPHLSLKSRSEVITACVHICAEEIRPFDTVSGTGFRKVWQALIKIGANFGNVEVAAIFPDATTISRHVAEVADSLRDAMRSEVELAMKESRCAATTDMWTEDFRKVAHTTLTIHFIDDNWNIKSKVLFTCDFPNERKTGENIRRELQRRFLKWGLNVELLKNITFVREQGANIVNALQSFTRISCAAHLLNTVLRHVFDSEFMVNQVLNLKYLIERTKAVVTFLKEAALLNRLQKIVNQDVETRWNSKLAMLKSVHDQYENIQAVLDERGSLLMDGISKIDMKLLINFLQPFKDASDAMERDAVPTLLFFILHLYKLRRH